MSLRAVVVVVLSLVALPDGAHACPGPPEHPGGPVYAGPAHDGRGALVLIEDAEGNHLYADASADPADAGLSVGVRRGPLDVYVAAGYASSYPDGYEICIARIVID